MIIEKKKFIFIYSILYFTAGVIGAHAADVIVDYNPPTPSPPMHNQYSWSGGYIGVNAGVAGIENEYKTSTNEPEFNCFTRDSHSNNSIEQNNFNKIDFSNIKK